MSESNEKAKFQGYTREKLYDLLPAVYRQHDAKLGKPLESLIAIIAKQVEVVEKDIGGLYDNWFIETCDEWVTAYIADLVGARSLSTGRSSSISTTNIVSQRAYVANTIAYRRRKGTLAMLEQLARDIAQWDARAVEFFQLLGTTQNINHLRLANHRTPDLRKTDVLELLDTPFDIIAHTVEVRRISSGRGYYNIPNIGIFLWRLQAFPSIDTPAFGINNRNFTFNPFGYDDVPVFNTPATETRLSHITEETNVPAPIRMRALHDNLELYFGSGKSIISVTAKYAGEAKRTGIPARDIVVCNLSGWHQPPDGKVAIDSALGRISLPKDASDVHVSYYYGFSSKMGGGFYARPKYDSEKEEDALAVYEISRRQVFVWNKIPADAQESSHLREMLRNDFLIEWVEESLPFQKSADERTITMSDGTGHLLSISLGTGNQRANLKSDGVDVYEFAAREDDDDGTIYVSKSTSVYGTINEAIVWWEKHRDQNAVFEIIDSEIYYDDNMSISLPSKFVLEIRAQQEKRPILGSLSLQGEKGSRLILDGLWINNPKAGPIIKVAPGDISSITMRHCTLVPGQDTLSNNKTAISMETFIRQRLCTWDKIATSSEHANRLATFLNRRLNLGWVPEDAVFESKTDPNTGKDYINLTIDERSSLEIKLEGEEGTKETIAVLYVKDEQGAWKKVYEFTIVSENGNKNMYLRGGNDDLEVVLDHTISSRIHLLDSLLFMWDRVPDQEDDTNYLRSFLNTNFDLPWLKETTPFTRVDNTLSANSEDSASSLSFTLEKDKATLAIDGKNVYEFVAREERIYLQSDAKLVITDSIVDGKGGDEAITCRSVTIQNTTVFGKTRADMLKLASNTIFTDTVRAKVRQQSCVRFSYVPPGSQTPRRYMCQPDEKSGRSVYPRFTSNRYGDPGYAQLHRHVDSKILEGADNGAEMGAFNHLYQPQRMRDLKSSLDDYLRFGLETGVFLVT